MIFDLGLRGDVCARYSSGSMMTWSTPSDSTDRERVAGGAADVGFRLHRGRRVDIGNDGHAGIALAHQSDVLRGDRFRERAAGCKVGDQHGLFRD